MRSVRTCSSLILVPSVLLWSGLAFGQLGGGPAQRPAERFDPTRSDMVPAPVESEQILPPLPPPRTSPGADRSARVVVEQFRFEGNTVFDQASLERVVASFTGRPITTEELQAARDRITNVYVEAGYVTSGAVIPDQEGEDGTVLIRVVEGRLADVAVEGANWYSDSYFIRRMMLASDEPLDIGLLEERLRRIQEDSRIRRIAARLEPGETREQAVLHLRIEELNPVASKVTASNDLPVTLGEYNGLLDFEYTNVVGQGDVLGVRFNGSEGILDTGVSYRVPVTPWDTRLSGFMRMSEGEIVAGPLKVIPFDTELMTVGFSLLQPVWRSRTDTVQLAVSGEWRRSKTSIDDIGIGFPGSGADPATGITRVSVFRAGGDWIHRGDDQVFALRQIVSVGLPLLDETRNPADTPDFEFVSFLTQARYGLRFDRLPGSEVVARADLQLATAPLFPIEQISAGGFYTVRGFRENEVVRDSAVIASLEARLPLYRSPTGRHLLQVAPFIDAARGWNEHRVEGTVPAETLIGTGVGLRYRYARELAADFYWGNAIEGKTGKPRGLQGQGFHFRLTWTIF